MLPPMRPRPIIPSSTSDLLQLDARDAAAALLQRLEIARRLRADQAREAERLPGDRQLLAVVLDHLQEEPGVRAALVQLAGRVQVARAEPVRDDAARDVARTRREVEEPLLVRRRRVDERLDADVVALVGPREQLVRRRLVPELDVAAVEHLLRPVLGR